VTGPTLATVAADALGMLLLLAGAVALLVFFADPNLPAGAVTTVGLTGGYLLTSREVDR